MIDLAALAPNYLRAQQRWPDAPTLGNAYAALRSCFETNTHGMVEHVKAFIECVCNTVLEEFNEPKPTSSPSTTDLLVAALRPIGLQNSRGASKLDKVLSGFNRLADALTEMRNDHGAIAHGKDAFLDAISSDHARAFVHTGDAILSIILNALEGKHPDLTVTREPYDRFQHLNRQIDAVVTVSARVDGAGERPVAVFAVATDRTDEAMEIRIEPSRLLFSIDRQAYVEVLKTIRPPEPDELAVATVAAPLAQGEFARAKSRQPSVRVVRRYSGPLVQYREKLERLLVGEGWRPPKRSADARHLIDSMLAAIEDGLSLDWKERESVQAQLRVASRRTLVRFGVEANDASRMAGRVLEWLKAELPDNTQP